MMPNNLFFVTGVVDNESAQSTLTFDLRILLITEVGTLALPLMISGVHYYRIAGRYIFAGDLFIARRTIYFFPVVDLEEQREKSAKYLPHHLGLIAVTFTYLLQNMTASYFRRNDLWEEGMSDEQFRKKADAHIEVLKEMRRDEGKTGPLPVPTRVNTDEISNIKLSLTGKLSFFAQSDNHDFNVGLRSRNRLRDALWEGSLGKV